MIALTALLCAAQVLGMLSTATFPALIPEFVDAWGLSNSAAGFVSGAYFAGYIAAVPVLVSLTDREDARLIYLGSQCLGGLAALGFALFATGFWTAVVFRVLGGVGLAGTYMVGARILSDRVEGTRQSRAIAWYTAHFGIGTSLSVLVAGEVAGMLDWQWAYGVSAAGHLAAVALVAFGLRPMGRPEERPEGAVLDLRPVLKNRPAMAYVLAYSAHVWELFAFRTWLVAFLTFALVTQGAGNGLNPTRVATVILLLGTPASILGNEAAVAFGRRRAVAIVMAVSAAMALGLGFTAAWPVGWMLAAFAIYGVTVMADSGALTAGAVAASDPERRGATMALHTLLGFAAGTLGPLTAGAVLDFSGGESSLLAWGLCFASMGIVAFLGPVVLARVGR
ncbi:MFS transporter [Ferruginivarius sediminum]|uniref:MFS transporter n=1 Tax=Ferruginivarius sediminum TaxID=2661937 RepID=A0A369TCC2_9PROT|nr:MFS transporter [Ferruginivarius sediminum]RDD62928.1 MFS transporter [Ferruginivarius sediminum]